MLSAKDDSKHMPSKKCNISQEENVSKDCHRYRRYKEHPHAVRFVFSWMLIAQVLRNYDTGALPVLLGLISDEFGLDEMKLGVLGAVPYVSAMTTAFIMNHPLQKYSQKWIVVTSLFFLSIGLALLLTSTSSAQLYVSRIIMGSMQAPLSIYIPVWVDEFTPPNKLTTWMGASQVTMIIGVAIGYLITGFTLNYHNGWRYSILVPCLLLFLMSVCLVFTKSEYFNVKNLSLETSDKDIEMEDMIATSINVADSKERMEDNTIAQCSILSSCSTELIESPNNSIAIPIQFITVSKAHEDTSSVDNTPPFSFDNRIKKISGDFSSEVLRTPSKNISDNFSSSHHNTEIGKSIEYQQTHTTQYISITRTQSNSEHLNEASLETHQSASITALSDGQLHNLECEDKPELVVSKLSVFKRLISYSKWKCLLANSTYMLSITILSVIYYVVTAVQFWTTRYLQQIYTTKDGIIFMSFSATAVIAPTTGIIFSGFMIDFIGGYKSNRGLFYTVLFCAASSIFATLFGILALIVDNFTVTIVGIWGLLFFGSFLVPPITGISVGVVEPSIRQFATTVAMVTYHIFGFALGSLLPGAILQLTGITRAGMTIVYGFSGLGVIASLFACITTYKRLHESKQVTHT